jgi:DNA-binding LacI/PurR family transcriptional regulator
MTDVAREAGVSQGLVSLAFRDAYGVSKKTRERILATAERMGYQPNLAASRLASKGNTTLGVFLLDLHNEVFADMFDGMRKAAGEAAKDLVITVGSLSGELDVAALDSLLRARVDVAVAAGLLLSDAEAANYHGRLKLVSVARAIPGFDSVASDDVMGATIAVEHLLSLGHRRIVHLASPPSDGYLGRREGYQRAMSRAGLTPRMVTYDYSRSAARNAIGPILESANSPTAIFTNNDESALGVLDALHIRGLRAPEDVSVVGYDNTSAANVPGVELTTVDLHPFELGRRATEIAWLRSEDPQADPIVELHAPSLVLRSSTGPPLPDHRRDISTARAGF